MESLSVKRSPLWETILWHVSLTLSQGLLQYPALAGLPWMALPQSRNPVGKDLGARGVRVEGLGLVGGNTGTWVTKVSHPQGGKENPS